MTETAQPQAAPQATTPLAEPAIGRTEFIALMAMMIATVAFSIDAMLPALPEITAELSADNPNRTQLLITSFVLGMGAGTLFVGPISDAFGRKPAVVGGAALYCFASLLAWAAPNLELVIAARVLQGLAASAARVVPMAITRDYFKGRGMARIVSFIMMVFTLVPAIAPLAGSVVIGFAGWRGLFAVLVGFVLISTLWLVLRVPEPLPRARRTPFNARALWRNAGIVLAHPAVRISTLAQTLCLSVLFASISSIHQIFDVTYDRAESFPLWFAGIALLSGGFSLINAALVMRLGMRRLIRVAMVGMIALSLAVLGLGLVTGGAALPFWVYVVWQGGIFVHTAMTMGNLNAIALEPMGHLAGTATSVFSAAATMGSVVIAIPIGQAFNGTPLPLIIGALLAISLAFLSMAFMPEEERDA